MKKYKTDFVRTGILAITFWLTVSCISLYGYCLSSSKRLDSNINILFDEISNSIRQGDETNGLLSRNFYSDQNKYIVSVDDMLFIDACVSQAIDENGQMRIGEKVDEYVSDANIKKYSTRKVLENYIDFGDNIYYLEIEYGYNILNFVFTKTNYFIFCFVILLITLLLTFSNMRQLIYKVSVDERIEKERNSFMTAIAHELKTPLSVIRSSAECINKIEDKDKRNQYVNRIISYTEKMNLDINDLLYFTKLKDKSYKLDLTVVNISELTSKILNELGYENVEINIAEPLVFENADYFLMRIVVSNLINNAFKYSSSDTMVEIRMDEKRFEISNHINFDASELVLHAWDDFYTMELNSNISSTGIGLSICRRIFELHNIKYHCESVDNRIVFSFEK